MQNFARKSLPLFGRDVGKICSDQIEHSFHILEKVAFQKANTIGQTQPLSVFPSERESIFRNICGDDLSLGRFRGEAKSDDAAAGPNIQYFRFSIFDFRFDQFHELLGLGSGHHRAFITNKSVAAKLDGSEQMLKRFALSAPLDQIAQRCQLRFVKLALEFQIQLDPFPAQHMREQVLRIQTWTLDVVLLEIARGRLKDFEHSHRAN